MSKLKMFVLFVIATIVLAGCSSVQPDPLCTSGFANKGPLGTTCLSPDSAKTVVPAPQPPIVVQPLAPSAGATIAAQPSGNVAPSYGLQPQPYVPHPSSYQETGKGDGKTKTWTIPVLAGTTLVYGGYTVGNETNGVYGAIVGPASVTLTITDGFYSVVTSEWGVNEYCFRVGEAIKYGWAHANLHPLSGMTCQ